MISRKKKRRRRGGYTNFETLWMQSASVTEPHCATWACKSRVRSRGKGKPLNVLVSASSAILVFLKLFWKQRVVCRGAAHKNSVVTTDPNTHTYTIGKNWRDKQLLNIREAGKGDKYPHKQINLLSDFFSHVSPVWLNHWWVCMCLCAVCVCVLTVYVHAVTMQEITLPSGEKHATSVTIYTFGFRLMKGWGQVWSSQCWLHFGSDFSKLGSYLYRLWYHCLCFDKSWICS